ncbi:MAG: lycopene beta-cyclase CrtY [Aquisalinus sp.]|nr:lycopene beta-cyclase CrtY [Aquisalinus sp.]
MSDLVIAGGGLAGLLVAWRCLTTGNARHITIVEGGSQIGGDHTWSFNETDLTAEAFDWFRPALAHHWPGYHVHFPDYSRRLDIGYCSSNSASVRSAIQPFIDKGQLVIVTDARVAEISDSTVRLENGDTIEGGAVIDATGFKPHPAVLLGYQKFVGQIIRTRSPHGLDVPIIMDATVAQGDAYRFVYCLPYGPDEVLIEDTYYEDGPELDDAVIVDRISAYAASKDWQIAEILHTERGILPITLASDLEARIQGEARAAPKIGLAGGLYNAVTGYSLPDAVTMAMRLGDLPDLSQARVAEAVLAYRRSHWQREKFFRLLNRMLFKAGKPSERYKVLQRFYRLDEPLVSAFYRGDLSLLQKARILSGKPPVPVGEAIYNLSEHQFMKRHRS